MRHIDITSIPLGEKYRDKQRMLRSLAQDLTEEDIRARIPERLDHAIPGFSLGELDTEVKSGRDVSLERTFAGMLHVVAATNNLVRKVLFPDMAFAEAVAKGSYFLTLMAAKEALVGLGPEEIAGMVAAGFVDVVYFPNLIKCGETAGMGGDKGWDRNKRIKTINASTLTALVMASMGHTTMKHGSYGNTTRVGSTDVPEQFGANLYQETPEDIELLIKRTGFWFSDTHAVKTLHYLSHLLMVETVNHIVGPMTPPIGPNTVLYKMMGVNHNVHPATIARAYTILHELGVVNLGGVIVLSGVDKVPNRKTINSLKWFRRHAYLDEISQIATIVSVATGNDFIGTEVLVGGAPFGVLLSSEHIKVPNTIPDLMRANEAALTGGKLAEYLACNVSLAMAAAELDRNGFSKKWLKDHFLTAMHAIESGRAMERLDNYITATGGKRISWS